MEHKYVINCNNKEDWLFQLDDGTEDVRQFTLPIGVWEKNELSDTVYQAGAQIAYHQHIKGYETFYIAKGSAEVTIRGKRCVLCVGDILHLAPTTPHGFTFLENGTVLREIFQEINMSAKTKNKNWIKDKYDGLYFDPVFREQYLQSIFDLPREEPFAQDIDKSLLHEVRTHDFAFSTFTFNGIELRQKVGRWECNNVKEIWQAIMQEGTKINWDKPHCEPELFMVEKGALRLTVMGGEYQAGPDSIISIPPYSQFSMEALVDDTIVYDCGCSANMLSMLEDLQSIRQKNPVRIGSNGKMLSFMEKYGCFITGYSYKQKTP